MSHHIVRARPVWYRWFGILAAIVLVCGAVYIAFERGRVEGGFDKASSEQQITRLNEELNKLQGQLTEMREMKAIKERSLMVEQEAHNQLKGSVAELQDETLELKEELAFYRSILAPKDNSQGLRIQSASIEATTVERIHHYKVVLTQVLTNNTAVSGKVGLTLEGVREDKPEKLELKQVSVDGAASKPFKFKYFQNVEGDVELPDGFVPQRMIISVEPSGRRYNDLETVVTWPH